MRYARCWKVNPGIIAVGFKPWRSAISGKRIYSDSERSYNHAATAATTRYCRETNVNRHRISGKKIKWKTCSKGAAGCM